MSDSGRTEDVILLMVCKEGLLKHSDYTLVNSVQSSDSDPSVFQIPYIRCSVA